MAILQTASVQDLKRLLELYPVSSLRERWPDIKGDKEEVCFAIAGHRDFDELTRFLDEYLSCCKQHVYVFSHEVDFDALPEIEIPDGEAVFGIRDEDRVRMLYVVRLRYVVVLRDPLEEQALEFLWPLRIDFTRHHVIVRFVVLEKNVGAYFDGRPYYADRKSAEEKTILAAVRAAFRGRLQPTDLHKGVKHLWEDGFMDSIRARYRKSLSTASEAMDEDRGIKEHYPDLYATLADSLLLSTLFAVSRKVESSVSVFSVEPSAGQIGFHRYSENTGDTDYVVDEILRHN